MGEDSIPTEMVLSDLRYVIQKADVVPVRRGHWIDCDDSYVDYVRCSECGGEFINWEADCAHTDFCPNCGCEMNGGRENA